MRKHEEKAGRSCEEPDGVPACPRLCPVLRALRHPPCFEAQQNELTPDGSQGHRESPLPPWGCPCLQEGPRLQRQRLPIEDHACDDLRVWATLGGTKVDTGLSTMDPRKEEVEKVASLFCPVD